MGQRILVTYASRAGSTAAVAKAIGETLAQDGAEVEVLPMDAVQDLAPYQAVVAGSAIQESRWLPEALQFVRKNRTALSQRPFAAFLVCMTLSMPEAETYRQNVAAWMAPVRRMVRPVSEGYFAGVLDLEKIPSLTDRMKFHMSIAAGVWEEGDHRNWQAIEAWAQALKPLLGSQASRAGCE